MTRPEPYSDNLSTNNNHLNTVGYIYDMVSNLKFMAQKANEPLLSLLLEVVEKESACCLQNVKNKTNQVDGASEIRPPE